MYGICTNIWGILMVNVTIYSIHGSYGYVIGVFLKPYRGLLPVREVQDHLFGLGDTTKRGLGKGEHGCYQQLQRSVSSVVVFAGFQ